MLTAILMIIQFFFTAIMGIYFYTLLKSQKGNKNAIKDDSKRELEKLHLLNEIHLTEPLCEKTRPTSFSEIIGQENGIKALSAALLGENPQHVIIYGPPGVGKTAAARLILKKAVASGKSPFKFESRFIEADATTMRFDERNIADPLIGSVHDPIYQGAGAYGPAGIPQPKPGAVTKAHGGILFIDEIGELHPIQINKLLKVLEDRRVFFESAYYSSGDKNIPAYIHEIFKCGLPADFRLVGATTRRPEEIPEAIRSRCVEIFFQPLSTGNVKKIAQNAAEKGGFELENGGADMIALYAQNGRDAVNIVQTAGSCALLEERHLITLKDIEWVIEFNRYPPRTEKRVSHDMRIGEVCGLGVVCYGQGVVMDIETYAVPNEDRCGTLKVTGIVENEAIETSGRKMYRQGTGRSSVDNILTLFKNRYGIDAKSFDIHINFPGGMPVDGPSAGVAIFTALYSSIYSMPVSGSFAFTGEVTISGRIMPVGGVTEKINAAASSGAKRVYIPKENYQTIFDDMPIEVICVKDTDELIKSVFAKEMLSTGYEKYTDVGILTAKGINNI